MKISRTSQELYILQSLGKALKLKRNKRRLSQEKLGESACLNPKFIGEIERGEKNPTILTLYKLALALDMPLAEIVSMASGQNDTYYET